MPDRVPGTKISELLDLKQVDLDGFASTLDVDRSTITRWRQAKRVPPEIKRIAAELEVRVGYFYDDIPDLIGKPAQVVAAREALRLFLIEEKIAERKHQA